MTTTHRSFEIKPCTESYQKGAFYFSHNGCNYTPGAGCFESERLTRRAIDAWYMAGGKDPAEHSINKEILALSEMLHKAAVVLQHRRITGKVNDISESCLSL